MNEETVRNFTHLFAVADALDVERSKVLELMFSD
jgi:hypothetical protein